MFLDFLGQLFPDLLQGEPRLGVKLMSKQQAHGHAHYLATCQSQTQTFYNMKQVDPVNTISSFYCPLSRRRQSMSAFKNWCIATFLPEVFRSHILFLLVALLI